MTTTSSHGHFFYPIPVEFHEHLELITKIVLNEDYCPENESENICHMFSSNRRQRTTCGKSFFTFSFFFFLQPTLG